MTLEIYLKLKGIMSIPKSVRRIAQEFRCSTTLISRYLTEISDEVFIASWGKAGTCVIAEWQFGQGTTPPRPMNRDQRRKFRRENTDKVIDEYRESVKPISTVWGVQAASNFRWQTAAQCNY